MRKISSLLLCSALLLSVVSCTQKKTPGTSGVKRLNVAIDSDIKGFDPVHIDDVYSYQASKQVLEGLFEYDYLKRPYELKPLLAQSMPEISKDGLTYTFTIRDDVYFHDDDAFKGQKRKLKASDIVYSFTRFADPHLRHTSWWIFQNRIEGLDELHEKLKKETAPIDHTKYAVSGLLAPDDRTFIVKLKKPNRQFLYFLAMPNTYIIAPEVAQKYGQELLNHPVGTGPFTLKKWVRNQKIILSKNPNYWGSTYPSEGEQSDAVNGYLAAAGKTLPFVDEVVMSIFVERQPMWLNFLRGKVDYAVIPKDAYGNVVNDKGELLDIYKKKGMKQNRYPKLDIIIYTFNLEDPVIGKNKWLRKAIAASFNRKERMKMFYNDRAIEAIGLLPPGLFGYRSDLVYPDAYNIDNAKKWLAKAKEVHKQNFGTDQIPPIMNDITNSATARQMSEAMDYDLQQIGYKSNVRVGTWPQFSERMKKKQGQMYPYGWNADYPDAENFLQLLYGPNKSPGPNSSNFDHPEYNSLYEKMKNMDDSPEKQKTIDRMIEILHEETPMILFAHRISENLNHEWLKNYKPHAINTAPYKYLDIDLNVQEKRLPKL